MAASRRALDAVGLLDSANHVEAADRTIVLDRIGWSPPEQRRATDPLTRRLSPASAA